MANFKLKLTVQIASMFTIVSIFISLKFANPDFNSILVAVKLQSQTILIANVLNFEKAYFRSQNKALLKQNMIFFV